MPESLLYADSPKPAGSVFMGQVTPIGNPVNGLYSISGQLTNAQILTGNSVPVDAIPAVPGKIIVPKLVITRQNYAVAYGANRQWSLRWTGIAVDITTAQQIVNTVVPQTDTLMMASKTQSLNPGQSVDVRGLKVIWFASADATLGDPANFVNYYIEYSIIDRP